MNWQKYELGYQTAGTTVRVDITGDGPNVRLMDSHNYGLFVSGRSARGYGGHAKSSPVLLQIPNNGTWYVVLDFGGYQGSCRSSVRVLTSA